MEYTAQKIKQELMNQGDAAKAQSMQRFFKTGHGEYGEGDVFIGLSNPQVHALVKQYKSLAINEIEYLLCEKFHECRSIALLILVEKFKKTKTETERGQIYRFYLQHADFINNWDLVDLSCGEIVGCFLFDKPKDDLYALAQSGHLWRERIAIVSTIYFIRHQKFDDTLAISEILLHHSHDLIHKAVGWMLREVGKRDLATERNFLLKHYQTMPRTMLREVGKRDLATERNFLLKHYQTMPRTMLRYAIEKFDEADRQAFLKGTL